MSFYKTKMPLRLFMTGKPKGRSLKSIREKAQEMCAKPETRGQGIMLGAWKDKCQLATKW